jgi:hypothetical protein
MPRIEEKRTGNDSCICVISPNFVFCQDFRIFGNSLAKSNYFWYSLCKYYVEENLKFASKLRGTLTAQRSAGDS